MHFGHYSRFVAPRLPATAERDIRIQTNFVVHRRTVSDGGLQKRDASTVAPRNHRCPFLLAHPFNIDHPTFHNPIAHEDFVTRAPHCYEFHKIDMRGANRQLVGRRLCKIMP